MNLDLTSYLKIFIGAAFIALSIIFTNILLEKNVFPCHQDESTYFTASKLFYETNSLKSTISINEQRSLFGEYNWYGPFFGFFYGSIAKIFGFNTYFFFIVNFILLAISLFAVKLINLEKTDYIKFLSIFISTYSASSLIFTYFPEIFVIFCSIILLAIYLKCEKDYKFIYLFCTLILIFSFIRLTLLFWVFSILFIKNSKINIKTRLFIVIIILSIGVLFMKFFTAPASIRGMGDIHNGSLIKIEIINTISHIINNIYSNLYEFFKKGNSSVIFFLCLFLISIHGIIFGQKKHNSQLIGLFVVVIVTFSFILLLYSTSWFYFEKQIAFTFPILIYIIVKTKTNSMVTVFLSIFMFFPFSISKARENIRDRINSFIAHEKLEKEIANFSEITKYLSTSNSEVNILLHKDDFSIPSNLLFSILPTSKNGIPILYTSSNYDINSTDDLKFKLYNRVKIDYILTSQLKNLPNTQLVYNSNNIYLYKLGYK